MADLADNSNGSDAREPVAPASVDSFEVLGHERLLKDEAHGDVSFYDHGGTAGKYAYVGSWQAFCAGTGVNVINVNDPTDPRLVGIVGSITASRTMTWSCGGSATET